MRILTKPTSLRSITPLRLSLRRQSTSVNTLNKNELPFTHTSTGPKEVKYTADHEWISLHPDGTAFLGITKYASDALGDATYIELPEVDREIDANESIGSVESVKSASEVYMPLKSTVTGINEELENTPQLINTDPQGKGWMVKFQVEESENNGKIMNELYTLEQYENFLKTAEE
ncbi:hypothetical protein KAFR_0K00450 [Kazachstania africana CBS 2517]|uniref:Glycine cleavage system H protein n=1 Tax=Kazachstania africana (strain ATCC 22294 / BCRC 22015 / CBS 2517 / CECT 1963 / NBRC 1671 / NRRL Y-8276) TaxID=1071382 RepID=H2B1A0_KAZAF|nr:hypothetical protein KAFR_0K00450 [Kazachstania africana CBS 2517]CCF60400.1 hypothetical protein KAFR_0K00450 [Kazachstania africana CBS 2517]